MVLGELAQAAAAREAGLGAFHFLPAGVSPRAFRHAARGERRILQERLAARCRLRPLGGLRSA